VCSARPERARYREARHGEGKQSTIAGHYRTADSPGLLQSGAQHYHAGERIVVEQLNEARQSHHRHISQAGECIEKFQDVESMITRDNNEIIKF